MPNEIRRKMSKTVIRLSQIVLKLINKNVCNSTCMHVNKINYKINSKKK